MPSTLLTAKIRGIRSYSPLEELCQSIEFMPLTLIVGANGTGKTTIIEALKFIISGEEPPQSDCRRNFVHTPRQEDKRFPSGDAAYASIEITFRNSVGQTCVAQRLITRFGVTKSSPPQILSTYKIGGSPWVTVNRQDDWNKVMPKLFGLPNQAILSNVILCHQEDNLWCMGDSSSVKQVFDKVFGCEQYKKEIKHIDEEIRGCKKQIQIKEGFVARYAEEVKRKRLITQRLETLKGEVSKLAQEIGELDSVVGSLNEKKRVFAEKIRHAEKRSKELDSLRQNVRVLVDRDNSLKESLSAVSFKRPAPTVERQQPVRKKPAPDPTAQDLDCVIGNFGKMTTVVDAMPISEELEDLKKLMDETLSMIQKIKNRFVVMADEPPPAPVVEEPNNDEIFAELERRRMVAEKKMHQNLEELEKVRDKLKSLEQQMIDDVHTDADIDQAKTELEKLENQVMSARDKRSMKFGSKQQMDRELGNLKTDLSSLRRSNFMYAESLGHLVCNRLIMDDLEKLKLCFQESIITFHDQMILKINEVLRARWRQIYQGNDIESIELVDEEVTKGKDKKSFNYHMAMRKNGVRMKMREKSSAGQRALACIILRMTLAELFVRDFAFIALDEPTANLDLANVQALAKSIGAYVRKRTQKGAKIQWIIITHDEQFLRALDEECSPYFYKIQMNHKDGCSRIVKVSFRESGFIESQEINETG